MTARTHKSSAKKRDHPPYEEMITETLTYYNRRNGTSLAAMKSYMDENFELPENFGQYLSQALKRMVESGKVAKIKASYVLTKEGKSSTGSTGGTKTRAKKEKSEEEEGDDTNGDEKGKPRKPRAVSAAATTRKTRSMTGKGKASGLKREAVIEKKSEERAKKAQDKARETRAKKRERVRRED
jgi:histone H1/5